MQAKFLHIADCHLGYFQYRSRDRYNDFAKAFHAAIKVAIDERVDFVALAGDLFEKRSIDALTLNQAIAGLETLKQAGIPCLAVEGNHEHRYYLETLGWMQFLAVRGLLILLDMPFVEGVPQIKPYASRRGSYFEPKPGLRVYGLRYLGASAPSALTAVADALAGTPADGVEYAVFMTHAGIEGVLPEQMGGLSPIQLAGLRPYVDYVALGHIHKPYEMDGWIYNPGSLETCSAMEASWPERGCYLVEVDTECAGEPKHKATLHPVPRRAFHRLSMKTDLYSGPDEFHAACRQYLERRARDLGKKRQGEDEAPVVELQLTGVLPFDRSDLDMAAVEAMVREVFAPLTALIRNLTTPAEYAVETGENVSRPALERRVMADLFARDVRYREKSELYARLALGLKQLALDGASPEALVEDLDHEMRAVAEAPIPQAEE
jgi:DNA repair exonuclease SbcCD nuclease subunit